ncbi:hypothetical protein EMPS_05609 [Entomortierella parvispora]|uniref:Uncharacterized protein n=1 Tax=Entomortierella parvispora TaxID=205924 RepID=A0A9P3HAQ6_9FUNG|nr:hypothetical protein EMPS_05609 [Entomortierella parvispora]
MGNSKSRPSHQDGYRSKAVSSRSSKHSKFLSITGHHSANDRVKPASRSSKYYQQNQQPLPNDSGHYSVHGFMTSATPGSPIDNSTDTGGAFGSGSRTGGAGGGHGAAAAARGGDGGGRGGSGKVNGGGGGAGGNGDGADAAGGSRWSYHPNLSSPGRLDQQKKSSDSSLHFQYGGSRLKGGGTTTPSSSGLPVSAGAGGATGGAAIHASRVAAGGGSRMTTHNAILGQSPDDEDSCGYHSNHPKSSSMARQGGQGDALSRPTSVSPHPNNSHYQQQQQGRFSTLHPSHPQAQPQQHSATPTVRASVSPSTIPFAEDEHTIGHSGTMAATGGMVTSMAGLQLAGGDSKSQNNSQLQHHQVLRLQQQQQQEYNDHQQRLSSMHSFLNNAPTNNSNRASSHPHPNGGYGVAPTVAAATHGGGSRTNSFLNNTTSNNNNTFNSQGFHPTDNSHLPSYPSHQQQDHLPSSPSPSPHPGPHPHHPLITGQQPRLTTTFPAEKEREATPSPLPAGQSSNKQAEILAGAGPLIDMGSSGAARHGQLPGAHQVFARLARQNPTNPKETEKRGRIFGWVDQVTDALTFNPDPDAPGWIIPVFPDDLDHPET